MPQVSPSVLAWARETAGLTRDEAARKLKLGQARDVRPADRLAAMESGEAQPTRAMLRRMASHYRRPLVAPYLAEPPRPSAAGTDFRTLDRPRSARRDALVQALVRDAVARQGIVRSQLEDENAAEVAFVGTLALQNGEAAALSALSRIFDPVLQTGEARPGFEELRSAIESYGVFVLLRGDLGSRHSALDTTDFRGFVIGDRIAPFIVINSNDVPTAWSFALLHEVVHLLLGHTGVSGSDADSETERFCNDVASEWLLPITELDSWPASGLADDELAGQLGRFAQTRRVSRVLVAYRLLRAGKLDRAVYGRLVKAFRREWRHERRHMRTGVGGPDYYVVCRHHIGKPLLDLVARGLGEGSLATTKAAIALGVKPTQVSRVLGKQA